jgi:hypothetical protein
VVESVVKISVVSVIDDDSDEVEEAKGVVDSVEISVDNVSVTVLESGSVDEIEEETSVEVLKGEVSVVKSVGVDSDEVSVVESGVEISGEEVSVVGCKVEVSSEDVSVTVLDEESVDE